MMDVARKSVWGGIFIAIGTLVFLSLYPSPLGAFLFSVGLLSIFLLELKLFTGAVTYLDKTNWREVGLILICNLVGCALLFLLPPSEIAATIVQNKASAWPLLIFVRSALCGVMISSAVLCHKKNTTWMSMLYVMVFILAGFDHSIANACFIISGRAFTWPALKLFLISVAGNTVGSVAFYRTGVKK